MLHILAIASVLLLFGSPASGQYTLPVYSLTIAEEDLNALLADPFSNVVYPAELEHDGHTYECEVRFRGATARELPKKSWKIFFEGEGPLGEGEANLNAEYRDRSMMRNPLCLDLARVMGLPAPDWRFISLVVNGEYWGVYSEVESVDQRFFERRGLVSRALFKAGGHGSRFGLPIEPERLGWYYEQKEGGPEMRDSLGVLCARFQDAGAVWIEEHIAELLDVSNILKYFALQFAVLNYDGVTKNFYLSRRGDTSWRLVPWDCDATLGNDWTGAYVLPPDDLGVHVLGVQAVFQRLMAIPEYEQQYLEELEYLAATGFDSVAVRAAALWNEIRHDVCLDTMKRGTDEEFDLEQTRITEWLGARRDALLSFDGYSRLEVLDLSGTTVHIGTRNETITFAARISGCAERLHAILYDADLNEHWVRLYDDGSHGDTLAGDLLYTRRIALPDLPPPFYYGFSIEPAGDFASTVWPWHGTWMFAAYGLHLPTITLDAVPPATGDIEIEAAFVAPDEVSHGISLRNASDRDLHLSGYLIRLGNTDRVCRIGIVPLLSPGDRLLFCNHPWVIESYADDAVVEGGYYFAVAPGDTVELCTTTGVPLTSRGITEIEPLLDPATAVVINEINYCSSPQFDTGDWIELHAPVGEVSLAGWSLCDDGDDHVFEFPPWATVPARGYRVVAASPNGFLDHHPEFQGLMGGFDFGFSDNEDEVRLFDGQGRLMDRVCYEGGDPWPGEPNGGGPTLELVDPLRANLSCDWWRSSEALHGTPGARNSVTTPTVPGPQPLVAREWRIVSAYPNPFNGSVTIDFVVPRGGPLEVEILDVLGRRVRALSVTAAVAGEHRVSWAGRVDGGGTAASGVYFVRLVDPVTSPARRITLIR